MKKGFTLVELLAVIVILAIILAIAVPGISSLITSTTKNSFEDDAKMVIKAVNYKLMNDSSYDVTTLNASNLTTELGLSASNYSSISVTKVKGDIKVKITGQNKWAGLTAYGTTKKMNVTNTSTFPGYADNSGASEPELGSNMIPIMYYNGNWVKADKNNLVGTYSWYDYTNKKWANAVTVTSGTLSTYQAASVGTVVNEADILTYLVWIPRYKYAIPTGSGARTINIVFEGNTKAKSTGNAVDTNYLTHPAFSFGGSELNGFWAGKFETTGTINAITVKPNLQALVSQSVSSFFTAIRNMEASGNSYGFNSNEVDTHMMKNDEWGAVAYLTQSTYGLNSEVYKNNSSGFYTGRSGGNVAGSQVKISGNEYIDTGFYKYDGTCASTTTLAPGIDANCTTVGNTMADKTLAYKASTTGTIYGIYDMSGGVWDCVMGNYQNYSGCSSGANSGFNGSNGDGTTTTNGLAFPDSKYYNLYTTTTESTACSGGICYGQALSETSGWYSDYANFVISTYPWLFHGGCYNDSVSAGIFGSYCFSGRAYEASTIRVVVAPAN